MDGLRLALALLTILPGTSGGAWVPARTVIWYPVVGLLLGLLLALAAAGLMELWTPLLAAAVLVALWAVLTGALHLDGLADTADAAFAPLARERRLEILRDVHHGTFALVAVLLLLLLKVAALAALDGRGMAASLLVATVAGRALVVPAVRWFPPARPGGMGQAVRDGATPLALTVAWGVAGVVALIALGWQGGLAVVAVQVACLAGAAWLTGRFGGLNGDTYGALIEVGELLVLVVCSTLLLRDWAQPFPLGGLL